MSLAIPGLPLKAAIPLRLVTASRTSVFQSWHSESTAQRPSEQRRRYTSHTRWRNSTTPITRRHKNAALVQCRVCSRWEDVPYSDADPNCSNSTPHPPPMPSKTRTKLSASLAMRPPPTSRRPTMASRRNTTQTRTRMPQLKTSLPRPKPHMRSSLIRRRKRLSTPTALRPSAKAAPASTPALQASAGTHSRAGRTLLQALVGRRQVSGVGRRSISRISSGRLQVAAAVVRGEAAVDQEAGALSRRRCTSATTSRCKQTSASWTPPRG